MTRCPPICDYCDADLADYLKSLTREKTPREVEHLEREHDRARGPYTPPSETVHHTHGESEH